MKVYNEEKTQLLESYDLEKGYLKPDKLLVAHHEAVAGVPAKWHYETVKTYPNGGKDVKKVIDEPEVEAVETYDEFENIQVYIPYTEQELAQREIASLKQKLFETDYKAIKYAEGIIGAEEYEPIKAERNAWRTRINELEAVVGGK
ncbi:MAG: hypothetical protein IJ308_04030 [Clostridia bacterium]|nr:hypothetical protein [Clostridia bacterium]